MYNHAGLIVGNKSGRGGDLRQDDDIRYNNSVMSWQGVKSSTGPICHEYVGVTKCWDTFIPALCHFKYRTRRQGSGLKPPGHVYHNLNAVSLQQNISSFLHISCTCQKVQEQTASNLPPLKNETGSGGRDDKILENIAVRESGERELQ